ncbi:MAG TPA: helix-turn-helix domain-containing protein [Cyclobacteriaceae bacterium]|nr:helix-turn-helix transcriptional regulator [Cyclobacteriaceae bacterium]HMV08537.1 helix-turn-helix domain-containing protein [Cyclobacteriaceae bacterium]HMV91090.1 helix-turn-helix domain-containing protein [Cyclobacteriaceae bacterium]HMX01310.1 helix-turn-helix domain-containing protein [Cyclobacteriaceae bacterium]HMX51276.1 helix-turn-helix domain-containing protein [Cyclobacteriaceae bacterium]
MPDFIYDHKVYYNPVEFALHFIGGTWKMPILWRLNQNTMRYSELKKSLPHITHKMLSSQLRELEKHELITRKVHAAVPPKVEYSISAKGKKVVPLIASIRDYGLTMMKEKGIKTAEKSAAPKSKSNAAKA